MVPNFSCERFTLLSVLEEQPYQTPAPAIIPLWIEYVKGTTLVGTVASCQLLVGGWIYWKCFRRSICIHHKGIWESEGSVQTSNWDTCRFSLILQHPRITRESQELFFSYMCVHIYTHIMCPPMMQSQLMKVTRFSVALSKASSESEWANGWWFVVYSLGVDWFIYKCGAYEYTLWCTCYILIHDIYICMVSYIHGVCRYYVSIYIYIKPACEFAK